MARHPIVVLWAVPRSVSTAFERMMIERGDHIVFDEPFSAAYYFGPRRVSDRFAETMPEATWDAVTADLEAAAEERPVFVKDMAYHAGPVLTDGFVARFTNTFLIRDPRRVVPSMAQKWPDLTEEEAGFEALGRLHDLASASEPTGATPPVIDADTLVADPASVVARWCDAVGIGFDPGSLTWEPGMRPEWKLWPDWYGSVAASRGFEPRAAAGPPPPIEDAHVVEICDRCLPVYERLRAASLMQ